MTSAVAAAHTSERQANVFAGFKFTEPAAEPAEDLTSLADALEFAVKTLWQTPPMLITG